MTRKIAAIPLTILGGYLGAGKTTLLNALLGGDHGLRLAILVNDFGRINIDADLIASHGGDTVSLTNGCVCCSMGDNLAMTLLELAGRTAPPDHIVIEASGVADPRRVAFYGSAHPRLQLNAVMVVADAETLRLRLKDPYVGELVLRQLDSADLILLSKLDLLDDTERAAAHKFVREVVPQARIVEAVRGRVPPDLLLGMASTRAPACSPDRVLLQPLSHVPSTEHADRFARWSFVSERPFDRERLRATIESLPPSVLRAKGVLYLNGDRAHSFILQLVGRRWTLEAGNLSGEEDRLSRLVVIGPTESLDRSRLTDAFHGALAGGGRSRASRVCDVHGQGER